MTDMDVKAFFAMCEDTPMLDVVARLGGWDAVLKQWREASSRDAQIADVWEMMLFLYHDSAVLADRWATTEAAVVGFADQINDMIITGHLRPAQEVLFELCHELGNNYADFAAQDPNDTDSAWLAQWWHSWAAGFGAQAPRVFDITAPS
jgi:hypothetical protein